MPTINYPSPLAMAAGPGIDSGVRNFLTVQDMLEQRRKAAAAEQMQQAELAMRQAAVARQEAAQGRQTAAQEEFGRQLAPLLNGGGALAQAAPGGAALPGPPPAAVMPPTPPASAPVAPEQLGGAPEGAPGITPPIAAPATTPMGAPAGGISPALITSAIQSGVGIEPVIALHGKEQARQRRAEGVQMIKDAAHLEDPIEQSMAILAGGVHGGFMTGLSLEEMQKLVSQNPELAKAELAKVQPLIEKEANGTATAQDLTALYEMASSFRSPYAQAVADRLVKPLEARLTGPAPSFVRAYGTALRAVIDHGGVKDDKTLAATKMAVFQQVAMQNPQGAKVALDAGLLPDVKTTMEVERERLMADAKETPTTRALHSAQTTAALAKADKDRRGPASGQPTVTEKKSTILKPVTNPEEIDRLRKAVQPVADDLAAKIPGFSAKGTDVVVIPKVGRKTKMEIIEAEYRRRYGTHIKVRWDGSKFVLVSASDPIEASTETTKGPAKGSGDSED